MILVTLVLFFLAGCTVGGILAARYFSDNPITPDGEDLRHANERLRRENQWLIFKIESSRAVREQYKRECG